MVIWNLTGFLKNLKNWNLLLLNVKSGNYVYYGKYFIK